MDRNRMRLSSLADYAVVMMAAAARHDAATRFSATLLAAETGVPLPTAQKLTGRLAAAGLLASSRGAAGGFALARAADAITLADIVEAVDGPIALTSCVDEAKHDCALESACRVRPHWAVVNEAVRGAFESVSLASLAANASPVRPEPVEGPSFSSPISEQKNGASTSSARTELAQVSVA